MSCLNPHDPQMVRIFSTDGAFHTIAASNGGGAGARWHTRYFAQNTRDEVRFVNGDGCLAGALAAEPGMKQQNYILITTQQETHHT